MPPGRSTLRVAARDVGTPPAPTGIPSIRLVTATPSDAAPSPPTGLSPRPPNSPPRPRLVPKKSKLGLFSSKDRSTPRERDISDVVRRVGGVQDARGSARGFEIFVDPSDDPDIGEILVVRKKKSRVGLDALGEAWAPLPPMPLADATNIVPRSAPLRDEKEDPAKGDEKKDKWWTTLARGRKDSKEKEKVSDKKGEKPRPRSKSPGPFRSLSATAALPVLPAPTLMGRPAALRTHSLDTGLLLAIPTVAGPVAMPIIVTPTDETNDPFTRGLGVPPPSRPPTPNNLCSDSMSMREALDPVLNPVPAPRAPAVSFSGAHLGVPSEGPKQGSLALRAMRSVRSFARLAMPKEKDGTLTKKKSSTSAESMLGLASATSSTDKDKDKDKRGSKRSSKSSVHALRSLSSTSESKRSSESSVGVLRIAGDSKRGSKSSAAEPAVSSRGLPPSAHRTSQASIDALKAADAAAVRRLSASSTLSVDPRRISTGSSGLSVRWDETVRDRRTSTDAPPSALGPSTTAALRRVGERRTSKEADGTAKKDVKSTVVHAPIENKRQTPVTRPSTGTSTKRTSKDKENVPPTEKDKRSSEARRRGALPTWDDSMRVAVPPPTSAPANMTEFAAVPAVPTTSADAEFPSVPAPRTEPHAAIPATPGKARPRPMSEQMIGRPRPRGFVCDDADPALTLLQAATSDLAKLVGRLDLCTPESTPSRSGRVSRARLDSDVGSIAPIPPFAGRAPAESQTPSRSDGSMPSGDTLMDLPVLPVMLAVRTHARQDSEAAMPTFARPRQDSDAPYAGLVDSPVVSTPGTPSRRHPAVSLTGSLRAYAQSRDSARAGTLIGVPIIRPETPSRAHPDASLRAYAQSRSPTRAHTLIGVPILRPETPSRAYPEASLRAYAQSRTPTRARTSSAIAPLPLSPEQRARRQSDAAARAPRASIIVPMSPSRAGGRSVPLSPSARNEPAPGRLTNALIPAPTSPRKLAAPGRLVTAALVPAPTPSTAPAARATATGSLRKRSAQMLATLFSTPELRRAESPAPPLHPLPAPPAPRLKSTSKSPTLRPATRLLRRTTATGSPSTTVTPSPTTPISPESKTDTSHATPTNPISSTTSTITNDASTTTSPITNGITSTTAGTITKGISSTTAITTSTTITRTAKTGTPVAATVRSDAGATFGLARPPLRTLLGVKPADTPSPTLARTKSAGMTPAVKGHVRQRSSLVPLNLLPKQSRKAGPGALGVDMRRALGMRGTLGDDVDDVAEVEGHEIPEELQVILDASGGESAENTSVWRRGTPAKDGPDDTRRTPPSPGPPPRMPPPTPAPTMRGLRIPIFHALVTGTDDGVEECPSPQESANGEDTKKSFDFTGEIRSLSASVGADRMSFVRQLESAFKTPAKLVLPHFDLPPLATAPGSSNSVVDETPRANSSDERSAPLLHPETEPMPIPFKLESSASSFVSEDHTEEHTTGSLEGSCDDDDRCIHFHTAPPSDGQLNTAFKFGTGSTSPALVARFAVDHNLTLSDIIPPPDVVAHQSHSRTSSSSGTGEDSALFRSIYAKAVQLPTPRERTTSTSMESDSESKRRARNSAYETLVRGGKHGRTPSILSFSGMSSFGDVRNKFEYQFSASRPPPPTQRRPVHTKQMSEFSVASVSSYGVLLRGGVSDPFDFGADMPPPPPPGAGMMHPGDMSLSIDDTFSFRHQIYGPRHESRRSVDSDKSSFYFRPGFRRSHRRNTSVWSGAELNLPPPSILNNRSYGHKRSDSTGSANSVAQAYGAFGANGGRAAWARHRQEASVDSVMSEFSMVRLGRPGLGDKMLESSFPLAAIAASPPESAAGSSDGGSGRRVGLHIRPSFETATDERRTSLESMFDETGQRSSVSSDSIFGYGEPGVGLQGNLFGPGHLRPFSMLSTSLNSGGPTKEDETMITMLDGGHVRRGSVSSLIELSPLGARKRRAHHGDEEGTASPDRARLMARPSYKFGIERMMRAQQGTLSRDSLENSCLTADGEDHTSSSNVSAVFARPQPASRVRPTTFVLSAAPGPETPPLSCGGSTSGGSQSSIDIERLKVVMEQTARDQVVVSQGRARPRGHGHRRVRSQSNSQTNSRGNSMIDTIEEEQEWSKNDQRLAFPGDSVLVVDRDIDASELDEDDLVPAMRKYYALRTEVDQIVEISRQTWQDTPWSVHALQSFQPPRQPTIMKAMLEHSQKTYLPLPLELRVRRISTRSARGQFSPYSRVSKRSMSPRSSRHSTILQDLSMNIAQSVNVTQSPPMLAAMDPMSPFALEFNKKVAPPTVVRPRVASATRRSALGWSKRKAEQTPREGKSTHNKENENHLALMSPNESLRISRPRPKGRATSAFTPAVPRLKT